MVHPLGTRQTAEVSDAVPGMAVVGPNTGTVSLRKKAASNTFWVRANYDQEIDKLVATASVLGQSRIGLVHSNDPLGQSLLAGFKAALAKAKLQPTVIASTPSTTSMEVKPRSPADRRSVAADRHHRSAGTAPAFVRAHAAKLQKQRLACRSRQAPRRNGRTRAWIGLCDGGALPYATKSNRRRYQANMLANGSKEFSLPSLRAIWTPPSWPKARRAGRRRRAQR
jgi:hypothetical protein